jgi:hypothetical protein
LAATFVPRSSIAQNTSLPHASLPPEARNEAVSGSYAKRSE